MIDLASKLIDQGIPLSVNVLSVEKKNMKESELISLLTDVGFDFDGLNFNFDPTKNNKNKQEIQDTLGVDLMKMARSGASLSEILDWIDSNKDYIEKGGFILESVKKIITDQFNSIEKAVDNFKGKAKMKVTQFHKRVVQALEGNDELKVRLDLYEKGLDSVLDDSFITDLANDLLSELRKDFGSDIFKQLKFLEAMMDGISLLKALDARAVPMVIGKVLNMLTYEAIQTGDAKLIAAVSSRASSIFSMAGSVLRQASELATPQGIANLHLSKMFEARAEALGKDADLVKEISEDIMKLQEEMLSDKIALEDAVKQMAAKDESIATLIAMIEKMDFSASENQKASEAKRQESKRKPSMTARVKKKIVSRLEQDIADLENFDGVMSTFITPKALAAILKAVLKSVNAVGNTIIAIEDGIKAMKEDKWYQGLNSADKVYAEKEVRATIIEKLDAKEEFKNNMDEAIKNSKDLSWKTLVSDHISGKDNSRKALKEKLMDAYGLDADQAQLLEDTVMTYVEEVMAEGIEKTLESKRASLQGPQLKKARGEKTVGVTELINIVMKMLVNGQDANAFLDSMPGLTADMKSEIFALAELMTERKIDSLSKPKKTSPIKEKSVLDIVDELVNAIVEGKTVESILDKYSNLNEDIKAKVLEAALQKITARLEASYKKAGGSNTNQKKVTVKQMVKDIAGRVESGEDIDSILQDYPGLNQEAKSLIEKSVQEYLNEKASKPSSSSSSKPQSKPVDIKKKLEKDLEKNARQEYVDGILTIVRSKPNVDLDSIIDDVRNGALSEASVMNAFAEVYGFKAINQAIVDRIIKFVDVLTRLKANQDNVGYKRVLEDFEQFMREETEYKSEFIDSFISFLHASVLSGINTFKNANIGGLVTYTFELASKMIANPSLPGWVGGFVQMLRSGTLGRSIKAAAAAGLHNENDVSDKGFIFDNPTGGRYNSFDYFLRHGFGVAMQKMFNAETVAEGVKYGTIVMGTLPLQLLKNSYLLGVMDVLLNQTTREVIQHVKAFQDSAYEITGSTDKVSNFVTRMNPANWARLHKIVLDATDPTRAEGFEEALDKAYEESLELVGSVSKNPTFYKARFKQQYIDNARIANKQDLHVSTVKKFMMMNDPEHIWANLYSFLSMAKNSPRGKKTIIGKAVGLMGTVMVMFPRITTNGLSMMVDYAPFFGALNALPYMKVGSKMTVIREGKKVEIEITEVMKSDAIRDAIAHQIISFGVLFGVFSALFRFVDDDEEDLDPGEPAKGVRFMGSKVALLDEKDRWLDITGDLGGFEYDNKSYINTKPGNVRVKVDGKWVSLVDYKYHPGVLPILRYFGQMRDQLTYDYDGYNENFGSFSDVTNTYLTSTGEMSFAQTLSGVASTVRSKDPFNELVNMLVVEPTQTFIPKAATDLFNIAYSDRNQTHFIEEGNWAKLFYDPLERLPIMNMNSPYEKTDAFGYPYKLRNKAKEMPLVSFAYDDYLMDHMEGKAAWDLVSDIPNFHLKKLGYRNAPSEFEVLAKAGRDTEKTMVKNLSKDERTAILQRQRSEFGYLLTLNYSKLKSMSPGDRMGGYK